MFFNVYYCLSVLFKASKCYHSVQKDVIHEGRRVERLDEILEAENVKMMIIISLRSWSEDHAHHHLTLDGASMKINGKNIP